MVSDKHGDSESCSCKDEVINNNEKRQGVLNCLTVVFPSSPPIFGKGEKEDPGNTNPSA